MNASTKRPTGGIAPAKATRRTARAQAVAPVAVDLATNFARGRDHAIEMMREALAIGPEREPWRDLRGGQAQDNLVEGYLREVIEDPSLRHGFTSILSAAIQNDTVLDALTTITLAETQAGARGADGTRSFPGDSMVPEARPGEERPKGAMDEAADILRSAIAMLDRVVTLLDSGAAYGSLTLLTIAEKSVRAAIAGRTTALQEEASGALHEAADVLWVVSQALDDQSVRGLHTLTELAKTKFDDTVGCFDRVRG